MAFEDSRAAEAWFEEMLRVRGISRVRHETIREYVKGGRFAYPKIYYCGEQEAYLVTFFRSRTDQIKDSSKVSTAGQDLDERLKFAISVFGEGVEQMTKCIEPTLLKLLELEEHGIEAFLVTIYATGEAYWCRARDFYEFATRYGTYQQYARSADMEQSLPYRVPTLWMKPWIQRQPLVGYPEVAEDGK